MHISDSRGGCCSGSRRGFHAITSTTPEMTPDEAAELVQDGGYLTAREAMARAGEPVSAGSLFKTVAVILGSVALLGWAKSKVL